MLNKLSFTVQPGQTLAIIGSTGSGKTTIVNLLARLYEATQGEILIDDRPISQFSADELRTQIGVVAQETFLFSDTIAGNIRFGRRDATEQQTVRAADIAQLSENINRFPEGYQTMVGERGITLSVGAETAHKHCPRPASPATNPDAGRCPFVSGYRDRRANFAWPAPGDAFADLNPDCPPNQHR